MPEATKPRFPYFDLMDILGPNNFRNEVLSNGPRTRQLLEDISSSALNLQPEHQLLFFSNIFRALTLEGDPKLNRQDSDQRDFALVILGHSSMAGVIQKHQEAILRLYIEAIQTQNPTANSHNGSIFSLLEAGKIVAPHLQGVNVNEIVKAWELLASQFGDINEIEVQEYIQSEAQEISFRASIGWFDLQVARLKNNGLNYKQIAQILGVSGNKVRQSISRQLAAGTIIKAGRIKPLRKA